jgi:hypothetical protein
MFPCVASSYDIVTNPVLQKHDLLKCKIGSNNGTEFANKNERNTIDDYGTISMVILSPTYRYSLCGRIASSRPRKGTWHRHCCVKDFEEGTPSTQRSGHNKYTKGK